MKTFSVKPAELIPSIDKRWLFHGLWKLGEKKKEAEKVYARMTENISEYKFEPKFIYKIFNATYDGNLLSLRDPKNIVAGVSSENVVAGVSSENVVAGVSSENVVAGVSAGLIIDKTLLTKLTPTKVLPEIRKIALCAATVGSKVKEIAEAKQSAGEYAEYFYIVGLASAFAEALTEYAHHAVCKELGLDYESTFRISPGYQVWPELKGQLVIEKLLDFNKIGVHVSETYQLNPEHSTTAMIFL